MKNRIMPFILSLCCCVGCFSMANAQKMTNTADQSSASKTSDKNDQLEFSHPLITESISPDTKIRFTYLNTRIDSGLSSQVYDLELEYAPVPAFSIHLDVPYDVLKPKGNSSVSNLDNVEFALHFANFAFAKHNVLLGYGISFGFPTGNDAKGIGSDHILDIEPFLNGGVKWRKWEWTAYFTFGIPAHQRKEENEPTGLESRATALYHLSPYWQLLAEFGDASELAHFYGREKNYDLTEGIKFLPFGHKPWILAVGAREPLGQNSALRFQWIFSIFYHFKDK